VSLRAKVLLAQAPLAAALVVVSWLALGAAESSGGGHARRIEAVTAAAAAAALVLAFVASARLTSRMLRPLSVLGQAARRIGDQDFGARARVRGGDEIAQLAEDFNAMATQLAAYQRSSVGELLRARQAAQSAIDSLPDPVLVLDLEGAIVSANEAAAGLLRSAGITGADGSAGTVLGDLLGRLRAHVLGGRGLFVPRGFEDAVRLPAPDGDRDWLPRAAAVRGEDGLTGLTVVLQDVTRLRRFDELRNDVVATVAHELKSPLTSLRMALHLCAEEVAGPLTEKQSELLEAAREDSARIQALVDDILDLARIQSGRLELQREPLDPRALAEEAVAAHRSAAEAKGLTIKTEGLPGCGEVFADRERALVVLANLVANAVRHTPQDGRIVVSCLPDDHAVRFEVADTGEGIAPEHQARVFDRFFRVPGRRSDEEAAAGRGSGLGLAIAREIVVAHGGTIGVVSAAGDGSRFWFTLPAAELRPSAVRPLL
jgi:signal transduction histidine kinase